MTVDQQIHRVVYDIETIGVLWESLTDEERAYVVKRAEGEDDAEREASARRKLALSPLTGEVVIIGMQNIDTGNARIHVRVPPPLPGEAHMYMEDAARMAKIAIEARAVGEGRVVSVVPWPNENALLANFWYDVDRYDQVFSFNGRAFDGPFVMTRSLILGVQAKKQLVPNRYGDDHIDLFDRLSYFGASRDRAGLDFWCRRCGITSPKEEMTGSEVEGLWRAGKIEEVCRYSLRDIEATTLLAQQYIRSFGRLYHMEPVRS
ncbi:MAG: ribonuclease H-like domain-containing protein [Candidatus Uhrbacteria bacterium]